MVISTVSLNRQYRCTDSGNQSRIRDSMKSTLRVDEICPEGR